MGQFTRKLRPRDATKRGGFSSSVVEKIKKIIKDEMSSSSYMTFQNMSALWQIKSKMDHLRGQLGKHPRLEQVMKLNILKEYCAVIVDIYGIMKTNRAHSEYVMRRIMQVLVHSKDMRGFLGASNKNAWLEQHVGAAVDRNRILDNRSILLDILRKLHEMGEFLSTTKEYQSIWDTLLGSLETWIRGMRRGQIEYNRTRKNPGFASPSDYAEYRHLEVGTFKSRGDANAAAEGTFRKTKKASQRKPIQFLNFFGW